MKIISSFFILFLFAVSYGISQPGMTKDKSLYYNLGHGFHIETYYLPDDSRDSVQVIVLYRISNNSLVFSKNSNAFEINKPFLSPIRINVEFKDSDGIIRERLSTLDTIYAAKFEDSRSREISNFGIFTTKLKNGSYQWYANLTDGNNKTISDVKPQKLADFSFYINETISKPIFLRRISENSDTYVAFYLDGNISFKSNNAFAIIPISTKDVNKKLEYEISYQGTDNENRPWGELLSRKGEVAFLADRMIEVNVPKDKETAEFRIIHSSNSNQELNAGLAVIDLQADNLIPGNYLLKITDTAINDTISFDFQVVWENIPLSLQNPEYALELMYYILTEEEYDKMNKGNLARRFKAILDYWSQRDPSPDTKYNEAMNEYFKRVDYAFFNFQTPTSPDGAKTEKGKVYILHGSPSKAEQSLDKGKAIEIWDYDNLKKQFIFQTQSNGEFKLTEIIDLQ